MPRLTERQRVLYNLETSMKCYSMLFLMDEDDANREEEDGDDPGHEDSTLDLYVSSATLWSDVWSHRYLNSRRYQYRVKDFLAEFRNERDETFRELTRVSKEMFDYILSKVHQHPVFQNRSNCHQWDVEWQLYVALDRLGHNGSGNSLCRSRLLWDLGHGTVHEYTQRVIVALLSLEDRWAAWPDAAARARISERMAREGFRDCVGFVDGTTFPLFKKPAVHGRIYFDRKMSYSINAQVVIDDRKRITHFQVGDPGSAHDSMVFSDSPLVKMPHLCFSSGEYLLSDCAYASSSYLVPAYKERQSDVPNDPLEPRKIDIFNTMLAKARVRNEHAIGELKGRWNILSSVRVQLNSTAEVRKVNELARACVVLHNMSLPDPWLERDLSDAAIQALPEEGDAVTAATETVGQRKRHAVRLKVEQWLLDRRREGLPPMIDAETEVWPL